MAVKVAVDKSLLIEAVKFIRDEFGEELHFFSAQTKSVLVNAIYRLLLLSGRQGPFLFDTDLPADMVATARYSSDSNQIVEWTHLLSESLRKLIEMQPKLTGNEAVVAEALIDGLQQDYVDYFRYCIDNPQKKSEDEKSHLRTQAIVYDFVFPTELIESLTASQEHYVLGLATPEVLAAFVRRNPSLFQKVERLDTAIRFEIKPKGNPYPFIGYGRPEFLEEETYIYYLYEAGELSEDDAAAGIGELIRDYYGAYT